MVTWTIGQERKLLSRQKVSAKARRLVSLLGALMVTSIAVNTLIILADSHLR